MIMAVTNSDAKAPGKDRQQLGFEDAESIRQRFRLTGMNTAGE
jgi:hypothetical protein